MKTFLVSECWMAAGLAIGFVMVLQAIALKKFNDDIEAIISARVLNTIVLLFVVITYRNKGWELDTRGAWTAIVAGLVSLGGCYALNRVRAIREADLKLFGYLIARPLSKRNLLFERSSWVCYLIGYEWLFRDLLLFQSLEAFSVLEAFLLNCVIYGLAHAHQGIRQSTGAFFIGWLLCTMSYWTGTFWPAFAIHIALSLSNVEFMLRGQSNQITI